MDKQKKKAEPPSRGLDVMLAEVSRMKAERETVSGFVATLLPEDLTLLQGMAEQAGCLGAEELAVRLLKERLGAHKSIASRRQVRRPKTQEAVLKRIGFDKIYQHCEQARASACRCVSFNAQTRVISIHDEWPDVTEGMIVLDLADKNRENWSDLDWQMTPASVWAYMLGLSRPPGKLAAKPAGAKP